jgi:hypothetical protein
MVDMEITNSFYLFIFHPNPNPNPNPNIYHFLNLHRLNRRAD